GVLMSPSSSPLLLSDPTCALCSKPVRSGGFIQAPSGHILHVRCGGRKLVVLDQLERARLARERATDLAEETRRRDRPQPTQRRDRCPVCGGPGTLTDWRSHVDWMAVEECPCGGFFIWTPLLDEGRLARLTPEDRDTLSQRLRHLRAIQSEAW